MEGPVVEVVGVDEGLVDGEAVFGEVGVAGFGIEVGLMEPKAGFRRNPDGSHHFRGVTKMVAWEGLKFSSKFQQCGGTVAA